MTDRGDAKGDSVRDSTEQDRHSRSEIRRARRRRRTRAFGAGLGVLVLAVTGTAGAAADAGGNMVVTEDGTVIDGAVVNGYILVKADRVTIRNSVVRYGGAHAVRVFPDAEGTLIEKSRVECRAARTNGVVFGNYTARDVHVQGCRQGFLHSAQAPATIVDSTWNGATADVRAGETPQQAAPDGGVARIGRVLVAPAARRQGLAGRLLTEALALVGERPCVLDAQSHLAGFYRAHGFTDTGPEFVEDGIPHLPMRRDPGEPSPQPSFADPAAANVVAPRAATAGDAPELVRLRVLMLTAMAGGTAPPPGPWLTATEETLRRRLAEAEPTMAAYVVALGGEATEAYEGARRKLAAHANVRPGELAACAVGTIEERLGTPGNPGGLSGHLFNVCTDPGQRRRGYARACMQELLRWYRERGYLRMDEAGDLAGGLLVGDGLAGEHVEAVVEDPEGFVWIASGTLRSVCRKGFPLICFIKRNVIRMTKRITGMVHTIRRMMKVVI